MTLGVESSKVIPTIMSNAVLIGASGMGHTDPKKHIIGMPVEGRPPSPCPCGSKECQDDYDKQKKEAMAILDAMIKQSERLELQRKLDAMSLVRDA